MADNEAIFKKFEADLKKILSSLPSEMAGPIEQSLQMQISAMQQGMALMDPATLKMTLDQTLEQYKAVAAQMSGAAGDDDYEDDDEDEMSEEEYEAFIKKHKVPKKYSAYMPLGAFLIGAQGEPYQVLALTGDKDDYLGLLEGGWGIEDRKEGLKMLESLLKGRHAKKFDGEFKKLMSGKKQGIDEDTIESFDDTIEAIQEVLSLSKKQISECKSIIAWDLERIAYLARIFAHVGFLKEDEAWDWFVKAAAEVKKYFSDWESYIISLVIGRGIAMGPSAEVFGAAALILDDDKEFLDSHPISAF